MASLANIRSNAALVLAIHDQREAAAFIGDQQKLNEALREAKLRLLGMAQEETHKVAIQASQEVAGLVKDMTTMADLIKRGNELMKENERLNAEARVQLGEAVEKFKTQIAEALAS